MADVVRWGIMGYARVARRRTMPAIQLAENAELGAVASRELDRARAAAETFGISRAYGSYEDLLADPNIDAVYIPLPNHLHKSWAIAALEAGRHVLCEKPLALTASDAEEMERTAHERGLVLAEAFMHRYAPIVQRLLELVRGGTIGELVSMHTDFHFTLPDDPTNVRLAYHEGGGALYDIGCYCISLQRWLAGREPLTVQMTSQISPTYGVDVNDSAMLDFGGGLIGSLNIGLTGSGATYLRIVGTKGAIVLPDGFSPMRAKGRIVVTVGGQTRIEGVLTINAYVPEIVDVCHTILTGKPGAFGHEPLTANMRVLDACRLSAQSGQAENVR